MITAINSTTYQSTGLGETKPYIKLGGNGGAKFFPNINMSFYGDEFFINLNRRDKIAAQSHTFIGGKIKLRNDDTDIFYENNGMLKWDIEFSKLPKSLTFDWDIVCSPGIVFYKQTTLTEEWTRNNSGMTLEEYLASHQRPENVVNSFAIFCSKANNKYKTGKLGHIYRPLLVDAAMRTAYADIDIISNILRITLPTVFMKTATYPVTLDPILGYDTIGGSSYADRKVIHISNHLVTSAGAGTATGVYAYLHSDGSHTGNECLGYFADNAGIPGVVGEQGNVNVLALAPAWYHVTCTGAISALTKYYPALIGDVGGVVDITFYYDDTTGTQHWYDIDKTALYDNPVTDGSNASIISLYLDYTETSTNLSISVFDSAAASENVGPVNDLASINNLETITITELITKIIQLNGNISELLTITENVAIINMLSEININDIIIISEFISSVLQLPGFENLDVVTITESINSILQLADIIKTENITTEDVVAIDNKLAIITNTEAITTTELIELKNELAALSFTDLTTITEYIDIITGSASNVYISIYDSIQLIENISFLLALGGVSPSEIITITENIVSSLHLSTTIFDIVSLSEIITSSNEIAQNTSSTITIIEYTLLIIGFHLMFSLSENISISEFLTMIISVFISFNLKANIKNTSALYAPIKNISELYGVIQ